MYGIYVSKLTVHMDMRLLSHVCMVHSMIIICVISITNGHVSCAMYNIHCKILK